MKIQVGEVYMDKVTKQSTIYPNKAKKYLLPCLKEYGTVFTNKINNVFKVAIGIGDIITDKCGFKHEKHLFILLDSGRANRYFLSFIEWIKEQPMYEDDYVYGNIQKSTYHMIVLKFPEKFWDAFETFKIGSYSKMFDEQTIETFFKNHPDTKKILIKDNNYKIEFVDKVNRKFNASVSPEDWHGELDFPPSDQTDKFNHHLKK